MTAAPDNITFDRGETWTKVWTWYPNGTGSAPQNFTAGWSARMQIRERENTTILAELSSQAGTLALGGTAGTIIPLITPAVSWSLPAGEFAFDVICTSPTGVNTKIVEGQVVVGTTITNVTVQTISTPPPSALSPTVLADEFVYQPLAANNGSDQFWAYGSTCLVDPGDGTIILAGNSVITTPQTPSWGNVNPRIWKRSVGGVWSQIRTESYKTREPTPLCINGTNVYAFENQLVSNLNGTDGNSTYKIGVYTTTNLGAAPVEFTPALYAGSPAPTYTLLTYRAMAIDTANNKLFIKNNTNNYFASVYAFIDLNTNTTITANKLDWYLAPDTNTQMRQNYEVTATKNNFVCMAGVTDVSEWNTTFSAVHGFPFVFRRLLYTYSNDITTTPLSTWIKLDDVEQYGGQMEALDVYVDDNYAVHLLYYYQSMATDLKSALFPTTPNVYQLKYMKIINGVPVATKTLLYWNDTINSGIYEFPIWAKLQVTPEGRMFVIYDSGGSAGGPFVWRIRVMEIFSDLSTSAPVTVLTPTNFPWRMYATPVRTGSPKSNIINLLWEDTGTSPASVRYLKVQLY